MAWDLSYITKQVEEQAVEHAQDIALEMYREINELGPIDTSRYLSNIFISVGYPDDTKDWERYLGRGGAYLENGRDEVLKMKHLDSIYITANIDYSWDLERGQSSQAPDGVFRVVFPAVARKYGYF